jgi:hypothetical protein
MQQTKDQRRKITFSVVGSDQSRSGYVNNGRAKLGDVATRVARMLGLAGGFQCLTPESELLSPETPLEDLPTEDVRIVSDHTPA